MNNNTNTPAGPLAAGLHIQSIRITGVTFNHDLTKQFTKKKKKFAIYKIEYVSSLCAPINTVRTVDHRFSSFRQIHRNLLKLGKPYKHLLKRNPFPTRTFVQSSTSKRLVRKRTIKLQTYLSTVLERLPTDLEKVNHDSACKLLRHFLLMQPSTATEDVLLKIQTDTECLESHHRPEFEQDYLMSKLLRKNPFDHRSDVTSLLNEYLIKVVQNDSRKNGISDQIKTFIRQVQQDNEKGSVRDIVRRVLMNSGNVGGTCHGHENQSN